jgi:hypothetical protein
MPPQPGDPFYSQPFGNCCADDHDHDDMDVDLNDESNQDPNPDHDPDLAQSRFDVVSQLLEDVELSSSDDERKVPVDDPEDPDSEDEGKERELERDISDAEHIRNFAREILNITTLPNSSNATVERCCKSFVQLLNNLGLEQSITGSIH